MLFSNLAKKKELRNIIKLSTVHKDWEFISFGPKDKDGQPTPPIDVDFALSENSARQNSIGKGELVQLYNNFITTKKK